MFKKGLKLGKFNDQKPVKHGKILKWASEASLWVTCDSLVGTQGAQTPVVCLFSVRQVH